MVNASSEPGRLAVNGMSYSGRNSTNANSAIIVSVSPEDYGMSGPLAGVEFQRRLEEKAFSVGNGAIPVERYGEYRKKIVTNQIYDYNENKETEKRISDTFMPCIKGKWEVGPVHEILPKELGRAFVEGMEQFGHIIKGFNDENVLLEGIESRTSSPVRIVRDEKLQSTM